MIKLFKNIVERKIEKLNFRFIKSDLTDFTLIENPKLLEVFGLNVYKNKSDNTVRIVYKNKVLGYKYGIFNFTMLDSNTFLISPKSVLVFDFENKTINEFETQCIYSNDNIYYYNEHFVIYLQKF